MTNLLQKVYESEVCDENLLGVAAAIEYIESGRERTFREIAVHVVHPTHLYKLDNGKYRLVKNIKRPGGVRIEEAFDFDKEEIINPEVAEKINDILITHAFNTIDSIHAKRSKLGEEIESSAPLFYKSLPTTITYYKDDKETGSVTYSVKMFNKHLGFVHRGVNHDPIKEFKRLINNLLDFPNRSIFISSKISFDLIIEYLRLTNKVNSYEKDDTVLENLTTRLKYLIGDIYLIEEKTTGEVSILNTAISEFYYMYNARELQILKTLITPTKFKDLCDRIEYEYNKEHLEK